MSLGLSSGRFRVSAGSSCAFETYKGFSVTTVKPYTVTLDLDRTDIANINVVISAGTSYPGTTITTFTNPANGTISYTFTPTASQPNVYVRFQKTSTENKSFFIDNLQIKTTGTSPYMAMVVMTSDYYPYGYQMPGRHTNDPNYRYGYNGMEKNAEMYGEGNEYSTEFRQYDPRLGRWMSLDPAMSSFPWMSPYVAFDNNPIYYIDPYGLESVNPKGGDGDPPPTNSEGDMWGCEEDPVILDEVVIRTDSKATRQAKAAAIAAAENKFWGGVQFFLGAVEVVGGAVMCINPATAPLGVMSIVHGADNMSAGLTQSITGEVTETFTHRGARVISEKAGASKETANNIATGVDMAYGSIGAAGPVKSGPTIIKVVTTERTVVQAEGTIAHNTQLVANVAEESVGHTTVWTAMTQAEKRAFQHSYTRHWEELGLSTSWHESIGGTLQIDFNNAVRRIRDAGKNSFFHSTEWVRGVQTVVNRTEPIINGQKYFYYETLSGKFVSVGKMP